MAEQVDHHRDVDPPDEALPVPYNPTTLPQPDPVEPRPYVEIRPAETPVDPAAAAHAMGMVDALLRETEKGGLWRKLRGKTERPHVEWLLVADGRLHGDAHDGPAPGPARHRVSDPNARALPPST